MVVAVDEDAWEFPGVKSKRRIPMDVVTLTRGEWRTNAYLVSDGSSPDTLLIDPVEDGAALVAEAERLGRRIVAIVSTHAHVDHVGGVAEAQAATGVPFLLGANAVASLRAEKVRAQADHNIAMPEPPEPDRLLHAGDTVVVGVLAFAVLDTPGHWRGDISLYEAQHGAAFVGDTLGSGFIFNVNQGCDEPLLLRSIREQLLTLPNATVVYPGHGPTTTIGHECAHNPALRR